MTLKVHNEVLRASIDCLYNCITVANNHVTKQQNMKISSGIKFFLEYILRLSIPVLIFLSILIDLGFLISSGFLFEAHPLFSYPGDHHKYIYMATSATLHIAPFGWRIGVPYLAGLLPTPLPISFLLTSVVGAIGAGFALFHLIRSFGFSGLLPWAGVFCISGYQNSISRFSTSGFPMAFPISSLPYRCY